MKAFVNDACIGCGLCADTCPEVFHMTDAGVAKAVPHEIAEEYQDTTLDARDGCPVNAIEVS